MSFINSPHTVLFSVSLVNMLSIRVAQWGVILLGLVIFGINPYCIVLMNSSDILYLHTNFYKKEINLH